MKNRKRGLLAEINVTPLVDVMLVLLIIFMITAPMLSTGLEVDLPETKAGVLKKKAPLMIVLDEKGRIFIKDQAFSLEKLRPWLLQAKKAGLIREINLKADRRCPYGLVAKVLAEIEAAGFTEIGLITRPET
ncbi:MAG TPA: biopolymer transporter ExbD [Thermodesulfatator atlanticus]|uniref:Biopolymer transporter ExbD n=1 Tax=Thermodesulfatator atlanticus TaxID=501497 RepID=A0A7V5U3E0_9BACT|nr:biopolymer transporter ExbD [Thermodesulfatator atlanticus]